MIREIFELQELKIPGNDTFLPRGIGIEVETENNRPLSEDGTLKVKAPQKWNTTQDGSLRNNGIEYVSKILPLPAVEKHLSELYDYLKKHKAIFCERTGIHFHLDCTDREPDEILGILIVYVALEPLLFQYIKNWESCRFNNIFCNPVVESVECIKRIKRAYYSYDSSRKDISLYNLVKSWDKYTALNIRSLSTLGTIEFRHLPGTYNIKLIMEFLNICLKIYQYGARTPLQEIKEKIFDLNTSSAYSKFITDIIGDIYITNDPMVFLSSSSFIIKEALQDSPLVNSLSLRDFKSSLLFKYL